MLFRRGVWRQQMYLRVTFWCHRSLILTLWKGIHRENLIQGIHCENLDWWNFSASVKTLQLSSSSFYEIFLASDNSFRGILKLSFRVFHFLEIKEDVKMLIISNSTFVSRLFCWLRAFTPKRGTFQGWTLFIEQPKRKTKFFMTMEVNYNYKICFDNSILTKPFVQSEDMKSVVFHLFLAKKNCGTFRWQMPPW